MDNLRLPFVAADEAPGLGADFFFLFFSKKGNQFYDGIVFAFTT